MQHLRRLAVAVLVSAVLGAVGAGSASAALPEFVPVPSGFESLIKAPKLETVGKTRVVCKKGANFGKGTSPNTLEVHIKLFECKIPGALCTSAGAAPGEIVTPPLTGTLGYITKAPRVVGLDLTSPLAPIMQFSCGITPFVVEGSLIGRITPLNKPQPPGMHFTLAWAQKEGIQKFQHFEGEPIDVLSTSIGGGAFEPSGFAGTDEIFFVGPAVEIKA
jgi:hypothetical protein